MSGTRCAIEVCDNFPYWRVQRVGDDVTAFTCEKHLNRVAARLQRHHEKTELMLSEFLR